MLSRPLLGGGAKPSAKPPGNVGVGDNDSTAWGRRANAQIATLLANGVQPPPRCLACIEKTKPILEFVIVVIRIVAPVIFAVYKFLYYAYQVTPANELMMIYGVALCFFGGEFCASIAAVECFRRTGGDKLMNCLQDLGANIQVAWEEHLKDDALDLDRDGRRDVDQLSSQEWWKHKSGIVLKAINPDVVAQSLAGLYQGFLCMMMTLKFKFAWTVSMACSIADLLRAPTARVATPVLAGLMPKDYHKYINQIINFTLKVVATHYAWKMQEVVSAFQSGLLGGSLVATGAIVLAGRFLKLGQGSKFDPENTYLDEVLGLPLAAAGIWFQLKNGFSLPFPYNLALFPLTLVEWSLRMCITWFPVSEGLPGS